MEQIKKNKKTSTNEKELLKMAIDYSIDLWTFKELFVKLEYNYNFYSEHWQKVSKIHLTEEQFRKAVDSMKKYLYGNN